MYKGKAEIERAKEYIDDNWLEKFSAEKVVKASGLSRAYFLRLFKKHIGMTPHEYYIGVKIVKLKEKLCDPFLSVTSAFAECGLDYNGYLPRCLRKESESRLPNIEKELKTAEVILFLLQSDTAQSIFLYWKLL